MIDLGYVIPGTTVYVPFATYDSNDPAASVTITGLAVTDIEVYKDGSTTQRASDAGYALLDTDGIDFDTITGIHGFSIDLADNTDAGFYEAGSQYWVVVSSITVDAGTISFIAATFRIGYPSALLNTTIATLASQTGFTLEDGSADDDAYNGWTAVIHDLASGVQVAAGLVSDYTGSTKTVTLSADPGVFTMAAGDNISLFPPIGVHGWNNVALATTNPLPNAAADAAGGLPISDAGGLDMDAILADTNELQTDDVPGLIAALNDPTAAAIADAVWDELQSAHVTAGSFGEIATEIASILTDTGTTLDGKIDTIDSNVDAIKVVTDALTSAAAAKLATSAGTIVTGTVSNAVTTPTTTVFAADDITEATADHYNGRVIIFTSGALSGQATDISDYALDTGEGKFTVTAMTEAPANNDTFVII